jgi:hypothetical protein
MNRYGIVIFNTTSAVMQAEKTLLKENIAITLIPTPREFSNNCGIALRFNGAFSERIEKVLRDAHIEFSSIHLMAEAK